MPGVCVWGGTEAFTRKRRQVTQNEINMTGERSVVKGLMSFTVITRQGTGVMSPAVSFSVKERN